MQTNSVDEIINRLRMELQNARKLRDQITVDALRSLIARIDNAEAIPCTNETAKTQNQHFAGAESGLGSTEAIRKTLTVEDIRQLMTDEISDIDQAITDLTGRSMDEQIDILKKKKHFIETTLSSLPA